MNIKDYITNLKEKIKLRDQQAEKKAKQNREKYIKQKEEEINNRQICCEINEYDIQFEFKDYGPAFTCSYIKNEKMWITNDEYTSKVNYCPICGRSAFNVSPHE